MAGVGDGGAVVGGVKLRQAASLALGLCSWVNRARDRAQNSGLQCPQWRGPDGECCVAIAPPVSGWQETVVHSSAAATHHHLAQMFRTHWQKQGAGCPVVFLEP